MMLQGIVYYIWYSIILRYSINTGKLWNHMVYRYGILCKLREWSVIARDYRIIHSKIVGNNKAKKMTALKIERRTKLNTNYFT